MCVSKIVSRKTIAGTCPLSLFNVDYVPFSPMAPYTYQNAGEHVAYGNVVFVGWERDNSGDNHRTAGHNLHPAEDSRLTAGVARVDSRWVESRHNNPIRWTRRSITLGHHLG